VHLVGLSSHHMEDYRTAGQVSESLFSKVFVVKPRGTIGIPRRDTLTIPRFQEAPIFVATALFRGFWWQLGLCVFQVLRWQVT